MNSACKRMFCCENYLLLFVRLVEQIFLSYAYYLTRSFISLNAASNNQAKTICEKIKNLVFSI